MMNFDCDMIHRREKLFVGVYVYRSHLFREKLCNSLWWMSETLLGLEIDCSTVYQRLVCQLFDTRSESGFVSQSDNWRKEKQEKGSCFPIRWHFWRMCRSSLESNVMHCYGFSCHCWVIIRRQEIHWQWQIKFVIRRIVEKSSRQPHCPSIGTWVWMNFSNKLLVCLDRW